MNNHHSPFSSFGKENGNHLLQGELLSPPPVLPIRASQSNHIKRKYNPTIPRITYGTLSTTKKIRIAKSSQASSGYPDLYPSPPHQSSNKNLLANFDKVAPSHFYCNSLHSSLNSNTPPTALLQSLSMATEQVGEETHIIDNTFAGGADTEMQDEMYPMVLILNKDFRRKLTGLQDIKIQKLQLEEIPIYLDGEEATLGRDKFTEALGASAVGIEFRVLSRMHCTVSANEDGVATLTNLSTNGVWINGEEIMKMQKVVLTNGDIIGLVRPGQNKFQYKFQVNVSSRDTTYDCGRIATPPLSRRERTIVVALADPLTSTNAMGQSVSIPSLPHTQEYNTIRNGIASCQQAGCFQNVILCSKFINLSALRQVVLYGSSVLHLSVRGDENGFHLEDGQGGRSYLGFENLQGVLKGNALKVIVLVTYECTIDLATKLVASGLEHVISINMTTCELEKEAECFIKLFYTALTCGKTIQDSFDGAFEANRDGSYVDAFQLLPQQRDHKLIVFPTQKKHEEITVKSKLPASLYWEGWNALPPHPAAHYGRRTLQKDIFQELIKTFPSRLVVLSGPEGIGKSTLALSLAHYASQRLPFQKRVQIFDVGLLVDNAVEWDSVEEEYEMRSQQAFASFQMILKNRMELYLTSELPPVLFVLDNIPETFHCDDQFNTVLSDLLVSYHQLQFVLCIQGTTRYILQPGKWQQQLRSFEVQPLDASDARLVLVSCVNRILTKSEMTQVPDNYAFSMDKCLELHPAVVQCGGNPADLKMLGLRMQNTPLDGLTSVVDESSLTL